MVVVVVVLVLAVLLFGLGAVVEGALWLIAVAAIVLVAGVALLVGQMRKR